MDKEEQGTNSEIELLEGILTEVRNLNQQLARTDERSRMNKDMVENLREDRIEPVEMKADQNENRSLRNAYILTAALTISTLILGAFLSSAFPIL